jgi:hypothetical protein
MHRCLAAAVILAAATASLMLPSHRAALAGTFEVKGPEITKGEWELLTNHAFQSGFSSNGDRVRHSFELLAGYAITDYFKPAVKLGFDRPIGGDTHLSTAGIEAQLYFGKLSPAIAIGWFTALDMRARSDETNTLTFGPLIKFGDDVLSLTLNPFLERTFGPNREQGFTLTYAVALKTAVREGLALGIEAYGALPEVTDLPESHLHEHRIGPVIYIDHDVTSALASTRPTKLSLEIGAFVGLSDAAPDWTGKLKAALTW